MGILSKMFRGSKQSINDNQSSATTAITVKNTALQSKQNFLDIHPDVRDYLWVGDGNYKNYTPKPPKTVTTINNQGATISVNFQKF